MTQSHRRDPWPQCSSLLSAPLIAAGAFTDAICCEGPRRDFAAEKEFRLLNAQKMYDPVFPPTAHYHVHQPSKQYIALPPRYAASYRVPAIPHASVQKPPPLVLQQNPYAPQMRFNNASSSSPPPSARVFRYEQDLLGSQPVNAMASLPGIDCGFSDAKWQWGEEASAAAGPADVGLRTVATLPENTPRDNFFTTSWPKIVECVRVEGGGEGEGAAPKSSSSSSSSSASESGFLSKPPRMHAAAKAAEGGEPAESKAGKARSPLEGGGRGAGDTPEREGRKPERSTGESEEKQFQNDALVGSPRKEEDKVSAKEEEGRGREKEAFVKDASQQTQDSQLAASEEKKEEEKQSDEASVSVASQNSGSCDRRSLESERGDAEKERKVKNEKEGVEREETAEEGVVNDGQRKKEEETASSSNEPEVADEFGVTAEGKSSKIGLKTQIQTGNSKEIPLFSTTTASTFSGIDLMMTPRLGQLKGDEDLPVGELPSDKPEPAIPADSWPVGYVPPLDRKYKKVLLGNQVYYEGGTFYLSETGAYLLGLRG